MIEVVEALDDLDRQEFWCEYHWWSWHHFGNVWQQAG